MSITCPTSMITCPSIDYRKVYPLTTPQFIRRLITTLIKIPLFVVLTASLLHYGVFCEYDTIDGGDSAEGGNRTMAELDDASPLIESRSHESNSENAALTWSEWIYGVAPPSYSKSEQSRFSFVTDASSERRRGRFVIKSMRERPSYLHFTLFAGVSRAVFAILFHAFYVGIAHFKLLEKYRLPRAPSTLPSPSLVSESYRHYALELIKGPFAVYFLTKYGVLKVTSDVCTPITLLSTFVFTVVSLLANETVLYWAHRAQHEIPFLYQNIHKQHHRYIASVSIAAEYAHPVEGLLQNSLPLLFTVLFVPTSPIVFSVWLVVRLAEAVDSHSGYCFEGSILSRWFGLTYGGYAYFHDFHHTANKGNYGTSVLWDYVCGTDKLFRDRLQERADAKCDGLKREKA